MKTELTNDPQRIVQIAQLAHEANAAYCRSLGDYSQPTWAKAPEWQQKSAINGVLFHLETPLAVASSSHENWFREKEADGWHYGPDKDPVRKTHPCMVPFNELPIEQQIKDHIFRSVVHACLNVGL